MAMHRPALILAVVLAAGLATAAVMLRSSEPEPIPASMAGPAQYFDQAADTDERIAALEAAVAEERRARQLLEDEMLALYDEIEALRETGTTDGEGAEDIGLDGDAAESRAESRQRRARFQTSNEARIEALIGADSSPERADWIRLREDQLRVEAMQARFEAQRAGDTEAMFSAGADSAGQLREELGDAEYEQYLEALGRPTSVRVGNVLESSPGQQAGLVRGDEIIRYDGERVFSYTELNRQQLGGQAGENVVVEILRDGQPMQVVMPRGPIGIEAQRRWRR